MQHGENCVLVNFISQSVKIFTTTETRSPAGYGRTGSSPVFLKAFIMTLNILFGPQIFIHSFVVQLCNKKD
jgi:hypothetical protein